jgi:hypothetical protein
MKKLGSRPDGALLSAETVKDYQLHPGDLVRLRLQNGKTHRYQVVPFHYVGVAKEFPTAPRDSFVVVNQNYMSKATSDPSINTFLLQTNQSPPTVAKRVQNVVGTQANVTNIDQSRHVIGSNLTAVELGGLTRIELGFALVLAAAACGVTLALGFRERRRTFARARREAAPPGRVRVERDRVRDRGRRRARSTRRDVHGMGPDEDPHRGVRPTARPCGGAGPVPDRRVGADRCCGRRGGIRLHPRAAVVQA